MEECKKMIEIKLPDPEKALELEVGMLIASINRAAGTIAFEYDDALEKYIERERNKDWRNWRK